MFNPRLYACDSSTTNQKKKATSAKIAIPLNNFITFKNILGQTSLSQIPCVRDSLLTDLRHYVNSVKAFKYTKYVKGFLFLFFSKKNLFQRRVIFVVISK